MPTSDKLDGAQPAHTPPPAALDPPMVPLALGGMAIWALAGLALLPFRDTLQAHGHGDWLAICLAGFLWGFPGLAVMIRHDANRKRRLSAGRAPDQDSDSTSLSS